MKVMNPASHNRMGAPTPTENAKNNQSVSDPTNSLPVRKWGYVNFDRFGRTAQVDDVKNDSVSKLGGGISQATTAASTTISVTPSESESLMEKGQTSASTSAIPSRSGITSASTMNSLLPLSYSEEDENKSVAHKRKSFVMIGHRPVAYVQITTSNATSATDATASSTSTYQRSIHKNPARDLLNEMKSEKNKAEPEVERRVFRIYKPGYGRKSIVLTIGRKLSTEEERIFESSKIRTKTWREWRKEATAQLPSNMVDTIPNQKTIKRLSEDSSKLPPAKIKRSLDYTKVREIDNSPKETGEEEEVAESHYYDDDDDGHSDSGSEFDEDRLLELERYQAGIDIKAKIGALRNLCDKLSNKRRIRQKLVELATGFTVLDEEEIPIKEHILYMLGHIGEVTHDALSFVLIWDKQIREINGKFGTVVANYFLWVRKMVGLEVISLIMSTSIIIIPQIVEQSQETPTVHHPAIPFHFVDLINGERYFEYSYLYYSGYNHRNVDSSSPFDLPAFRFLFCMLVMFLIFTYFIFSRLTKYYHSVRLETTVSGVANMKHFKSIICGWDFNCEDEQAKMYLHKTIRRELKMLADTSQNTGKTVLHFEAENKKILAYAIKRYGLVWGPWALHFAGNFLIIVACVIMGLILFQLCQLKLYYYIECVPYRDGQIAHVLDEPTLCPKGSLFLYTWILSLPALFASITTLLLTKFIVVVGDCETWNTPERKIYGTMIRAGIFNFTNIIVFYSFWISSKEELTKGGFTAETIFGKELYRLVVIQGMTDVFLNLVVKGVYHLIWRKSKDYKLTEFRTEYGTLNMFFIHSVSRISILFCPPMSFFVIVRLVVDYYQNRFSLLHLSCQEGYFAHVSHVYAPFLLTFFILCYLITSFMNVYYLTDTIPSSFAGPFIKYNISYDQVLADLLSKKSKVHWLKHLSESVFLVTFVTILAALAYFCRKWALAYEPIAVTLNDHIALERGDRDLLLKAIFEIGKVTSEKTGDTENKPGRLSHKVKETALSSTLTVPEEAEAEESEEEDITDQHIADLIHRVQRRKSLDVPGQHRGSGGGRLSAHAHKQHAVNVEAMVAMIVDERKKRKVKSLDEISVPSSPGKGGGHITSLSKDNHPATPRNTHHPQQQLKAKKSNPHQPAQRESRKVFENLARNRSKSVDTGSRKQNPYAKIARRSITPNRK